MHKDLIAIAVAQLLFNVGALEAGNFAFSGHSFQGTNIVYDFGLLSASTNQVSVTDDFYSDGMVNNVFTDEFRFALPFEAIVSGNLSLGAHAADLGGQFLSIGDPSSGIRSIAPTASGTLVFAVDLPAGDWQFLVSGTLPPAPNPFSIEGYSGIIEVVPKGISPPRLTNIAGDNGSFRFTVETLAGSTNIVEASFGGLDDLVWTPLATNVVSVGSSFDFVTREAQPFQVFRVRLP
jgi:hypothetical protein